MHARVAALILCCSILARAAEIRGRVVTVDGGEALARVQVSVLETGAQTVTARDGSFVIQGLSAGSFTLRFNAVGYRLLTVPFSLTADEAGKEFDVTLVPDNFRRTEKVEVRGDIFHGADSPAVNETNLTSSEIRETSTVLADDPFRSIQTMPGVAASGNNDFFAQFSVMGASYFNTSTYIDGILVPNPFHGTNITEGATLSILTSETVEDIKLLPAAYPEKYGDAVGAALDMTTREGSRTSPTFRASIGLADTELLGEGQLGHSRRGSWLALARKSYLGYLLRSRLHEMYTDVSFYDGQLKLTYDLCPNHTVSFYSVGGHTDAEMINSLNFEPNTFKRGANDFIMHRVGWRWTVTPHLLLDTRTAYFTAPFNEWNVFHQTLQNVRDREWVGGTSLVWSWHKNHVLEGGWTSRRVHQGNEEVFYDDNDMVTSTITDNETGWRNDGYVQHTSSFSGNRIHLTGGLRFDTAQLFAIHPISPQVSASFQVARSTQLQFGVGRYNQFFFPPQSLRGGGCTFAFDRLQTANHYTATVEQRLGESSRLRVAFFDREDGRSAGNYSNGCGKAFPPAEFQSVGRDYARGVQVVLQSRTANRLSGWIGYTLTTARSNVIYVDPNTHNRVISPYTPTLEDQRHTINVFASYRFSPSLHLSGKWLYGSGFPYPGSPDRTPLGNYERLDLRTEKDWAFRRWKIALYGEVLNLTNHENPRFFSTSQDPNGNITYTPQQGLPITPTAGVAFEF
jgi:hypothetical protein